jgi:beta-lactam-binding protein with PASTA domain
MRVCPNPKCRHENVADVDFCERCGSYLRWDPTRFIPAVPVPQLEEPTPIASEAEQAQPASTPTQTQTQTVTLVLPAVQVPTYELTPASSTAEVPGVEAELIVVSLRHPNADDESAAITATTEAGGRAVLFALVRNQSPVVDNYDIDVSGIPREWWTVAPPTVYLVPYGAPSGNYEDEVQITFHPPRAAEAEARSWPIEVVARSRSESDVVGSAQATLEIAPFQQLESELRPTTASGRRQARYALMVRNRANAPILADVSATDPDGTCSFAFDTQRLITEPGRPAGTHLTVRPGKQIWIGRTVNRRFEVVARAVEGDASAPPHQAVFRQRAWLPWWLAVVAPIVIAAAALIPPLLPKNTHVPPLRGLQLDQAQVALDKAGLKLSSEPPEERAATLPGGAIVLSIPPIGSKVKRGSTIQVQVAEPRVPPLVGKTQERARLLLQKAGLKLAQAEPKTVVSSKPPGTILQQVPSHGRVKSGTEVSIVVAVGSGKKTVPDVKSLSLVDAEKTIRGAGLTMAFQPPPGVDAAKARVSSQIPEAGQLVDASEPVTVFVPSPKPPGATSAPTLGGLGAAAAAAVLAKAGVAVTEVRKFDQRKAGTVIDQVPPKGAKLKPGQKVVLVVSAGYPEIVYSDGRDIKIMGGFQGKSVKTVAASADVEDEPSWQPNGALIAYRRGPTSNLDQGRIWVVDSTRPSSARPLTSGSDDRRPAFSPDGRVVAFSRRNGTDRDLCFVRVGAGPSSTTCISDPSTVVDRPAWSPDGTAILVTLQQPAANQIELLEYTSARPNSTRPSDWVSQGAITDKMHGNVKGEGALFSAWAADGKRVAIVANWGASNLAFFRVFLAGASQGVLSRPVPIAPAIRACTVGWRSDGGELVVTQADDCSKVFGSIVRVDPSNPTVQTPLRQLGVRDPAWQFISLNRG